MKMINVYKLKNSEDSRRIEYGGIYSLNTTYISSIEDRRESFPITILIKDKVYNALKDDAVKDGCSPFECRAFSTRRNSKKYLFRLDERLLNELRINIAYHLIQYPFEDICDYNIEEIGICDDHPDMAYVRFHIKVPSSDIIMSNGKVYKTNLSMGNIMKMMDSDTPNEIEPIPDKFEMCNYPDFRNGKLFKKLKQQKVVLINLRGVLCDF